MKFILQHYWYYLLTVFFETCLLFSWVFFPLYFINIILQYLTHNIWHLWHHWMCLLAAFAFSCFHHTNWFWLFNSCTNGKRQFWISLVFCEVFVAFLFLLPCSSTWRRKLNIYAHIEFHQLSNNTARTKHKEWKKSLSSCAAIIQQHSTSEPTHVNWI